MATPNSTLIFFATLPIIAAYLLHRENKKLRADPDYIQQAGWVIKNKIIIINKRKVSEIETTINTTLAAIFLAIEFGFILTYKQHITPHQFITYFKISIIPIGIWAIMVNLYRHNYIFSQKYAAKKTIITSDIQCSEWTPVSPQGTLSIAEHGWKDKTNYFIYLRDEQNRIFPIIINIFDKILYYGYGDIDTPNPIKPNSDLEISIIKTIFKSVFPPTINSIIEEKTTNHINVTLELTKKSRSLSFQSFEAARDKYTPNHIPENERVANTIFSILLLVYGANGIWTNDFYIPGKHNRGSHLHGVPAWIMFGAFICASLVMLSVVIDHYDKRNNEINYKNFADTFRVLGWIFFCLSLIVSIFN